MLIHEEYFKNIFNTVREAILILDENMRVLSANRSFFTIFKVDAANTIGSLLYDLGNGQWDIPHLRVLLEDILPKNDTVDDYEIEHNFESIGRKTMLLNACKIREKKDNLPIILLAVEDITEHKRLEELLTESEERYRRLFETASDGIVLLEKREGHIIHVNPATEIMLGYLNEECIGNELQDIGVSLDTSDFPAIVQALNKSGIINYDDVPVKTRSGQEIFTDIYMVDRAKLAQCNIRDVTERKRADEKHKEDKTFIENALNAMKDVFFVFDLEGRFHRWNKTLNSVTGYLDREIALMKPVDLFRNDDIRRITEAIQTVAKEGNVNVEALFLTKDGRQIPYEFSASLLSDVHGKPMGISGVGRDLTEHKKAEVEIKLNQIRLKYLLDLHRLADATEGEIYDFVLDACLILGQSQFGFIGRISADESMETILLWSKGIMKQCFLKDEPITFPVAESGLLGETVKQRRSVIVNDYDTSTQVKKGCPAGHVAIKRFLCIPVFSADRIVAVAALANKEAEYTESDVSSLTVLLHEMWNLIERKQMENARRNSEERFRQIAESAKEWIWEVNCDGLYTYSSPIVEGILGYKPEEIVGEKHFYDLYPSDMREHMKKVAFEFFATKRAFNKYGSFAVHKNGGILSLDTSGLPILDSRGDLLGYRGIYIDTTEYRKLEAQLRHSQKMEAVGTLAGGVAHDFNNILNVIIGYGSMVFDSLEDGSRSKERMNEVLIAADRATDLTKRLLVFSRKNVIEVKPVNINALILGLKKMLDRVIRENIDFTLDLADGPLIVLADAGLIEQVLINLAVNAKDAMQEGGRLTIGTGLEEMNDEYVTASGYGKPGKYALITVSDTGQGMDAEIQKKIFEPFFTTKGIGEGTGLGLAITYGIIKQHGGFINVYSEPGHGTAFKIYLPLTEGTTSPDMKTDAAVTVKGGNETVLVAEDDASLREVTRIILESFGYTVISAEDGEDAIAKFMENRERIRLALIDMIMPKKNGKEAGEAMRRVSPGIKILYQSGYPMDIIKTDETTEAGVDFIHKPFPPRDLLIKVREILDR